MFLNRFMPPIVSITAEAAQLLEAANRVIARALADGDLQRWSAASGMSWIAPVDPQVGRPIGLPDLLAE